MNIRARLTLRFSLIVATILAIFCIAVYLRSAEYRREEFFTRLEGRAITTARLLVTVQQVDNALLRIIDRNSIYALFEEKVLIFDNSNKLIYSSLDDFTVDYTPELLERVRREKVVHQTNASSEMVGLVYEASGQSVVVIASAYDRYGRSKLDNLRTILLTGLLLGIVIIVISGRLFARQMLMPLARMNAQVSEITAGNLDRRVDEGNRRDEIAHLAMNFNAMLRRIEAAFGIQEQFVSNASHELRTPLAAITSQLQVTLDKQRSAEEYRQVLQSVFDDAQTLVMLTNGLLTLVQSGVEGQRAYFQPVRVDELLFAAKDELLKNHSDYHFQIEYREWPEEEEALLVLGNERLLHTAFLNFMENACKFSSEHFAQVTIALPNGSIEVRIADRGIGIPEEELEKIFVPFYRASNAHHYAPGYGIGLSLCRRIIQLHGGTIGVQTILGKGSTFIITLPAHPFRRV